MTSSGMSRLNAGFYTPSMTKDRLTIFIYKTPSYKKVSVSICVVVMFAQHYLS